LTGEVWESTVAVTSTVPVPGGEVAVQVVFEEQETPVAGLFAPKSITVAPDVVEKPVPETVITVPGIVSWFGLNDVTVGTGPMLGVSVKILPDLSTAMQNPELGHDKFGLEPLGSIAVGPDQADPS
jgi:hypothetical protein